MRIGLFSDTYIPEVNGVAVSVSVLQETLIAHGHEVFVVTTHPSLFHTQKDGNILRLPGLELKKLYGYVLTNPLQLFAINDVKAMNLDVIHAHTEFGVGIYARFVAGLLKIPIVSTYHTTYEEYTHYVIPFHSRVIDGFAKKTVSRLSKMAGDSCLEVISPSDKTKELLEKYHINKPINVIPTGINLDKFNPKSTPDKQKKQLKESLGLTDKFVVLFVGRIATEKNIDTIIKALPLLAKEVPNVCLLIVGGGPQVEEYQTLVNTLKLNEKVVFTGKISTDAVAAYYHIADCFVSASLTETQGLTFVEALASGLAVFAADRVVLADIVIEGKTGYFFNDEESLAKVLSEYYYLEASEKAEIKKQALSVVDVYGSEAFYNKVIAVYQRVVAYYRDLYAIDSINYVKDCIKLNLKNQVNKKSVMVSVKTYYELGIRKQQVLTNELVEALQLEENKVKAYYRCLNKLKFKDRTTKEIYDFLTREFQLDIKSINDIVNDLLEQGFIDDRRYAIDYIARKRLLLTGDNKIIQGLKKKGINIDTIKEQLNSDTNDEKALALQYANKIAPTIKGRSLQEKQMIIRKRLFTQGFSGEISTEIINELNLNDDMMNELNTLSKIAEKAKNRYRRKYQGFELRNRVFNYLRLKGFQAEDIYVMLDKMEWDDEN